MRILNWFFNRHRQTDTPARPDAFSSRADLQNEKASSLTRKTGQETSHDSEKVDLEAIVRDTTIREWLGYQFTENPHGGAKYALRDVGLPILPFLLQRLSAPDLHNYSFEIRNAAAVIALFGTSGIPATLDLLRSDSTPKFLCGYSVLSEWSGSHGSNKEALDGIGPEAGTILAARLPIFRKDYLAQKAENKEPCSPYVACLLAVESLGSRAAQCAPILLEYLIEELKTGTGKTEASILCSVGPTPDAVPYLINSVIRVEPNMPKYIDNSFAEEIINGLITLGPQGVAPAAEFLEKCLECSMPGIRWSAFEAFGVMGTVSASVRQKLERLAINEDYSKRWDSEKAINALSKIDNVDPPTLVATLKSRGTSSVTESRAPSSPASDPSGWIDLHDGKGRFRVINSGKTVEFYCPKCGQMVHASAQQADQVVDCPAGCTNFGMPTRISIPRPK